MYVDAEQATAEICDGLARVRRATQVGCRCRVGCSCASAMQRNSSRAYGDECRRLGVRRD